MEQIYTIPVNEAFEASEADASCGCAFCALYNRLEENELELILGASMMEPDVRIKTNLEGFCPTHFDMMFGRKNRLGLALMLESHLGERVDDFFPGGLSDLFGAAADKAQKNLGELESSCYVCGRISYHFERMLQTAVWLWERDGEFKKKFAAQPYFCLPHYRKLLEYGKKELSKKDLKEFYKVVSTIEKKYYEELTGDVSWFCKKFDYRYDEEPWYNSKDAVERTIKFLSSDIHKGVKK